MKQTIAFSMHMMSDIQKNLNYMGNKTFCKVINLSLSFILHTVDYYNIAPNTYNWPIYNIYI